MGTREVVSLAGDATLVEAARAGDRAAFEEIYRRHAGRVRSLCARLVGDPWLADDLTQETFLRVFRLIGSFEDGRDLWPWLATIARHVCYRGARVNARERPIARAPDLEPRAVNVTRSSGEDDVAIKLGIEAAMEKLEPRERRLVWLHAVEERPYESLARAEGTTEATVRNVTWRALRRLRRMLADLRVPILLVTTAAGRAARRARMKVESFAARCAQCLEGLAVERGLAAVLVFVALPPAGTEAPSSPARTHTESAFVAPATPEPDVAARAPIDRDVHGTPFDPPMRADVENEWSPHGATPRKSTVRIEIRDPEGNVLAYQEIEQRCRGPERAVLPGDGPVRATC